MTRVSPLNYIARKQRRHLRSAATLEEGWGSVLGRESFCDSAAWGEDSHERGTRSSIERRG
jgi:hypothetical protein